jgi:dienelactone hydrolase
MRFPAVALTIVLAGLAQACSSTPQQTAQATPTDPGAPGAYAVGVAEMSFERASSTTGQPRTLDTFIWYPADDSAKSAAVDEKLKAVDDAKPASEGVPFPIIVWSHGAGGDSPYAPVYLAPHLASNGFVVIAPSHPGNLKPDCFAPGQLGCTSEGMADSYANRPDDLAFALESLLKLTTDSGSPFYQLVDESRVGIAGHSFGGTDTVRESTTLQGQPFTAALGMAPCVTGVVPPAGEVDMPLMMMGGDLDSVCPVSDMQTYYNGISNSLPHFLLVFTRGGHNAYGDDCGIAVKQAGCTADNISQEEAHKFINFYATAFFKTYVAGDAAYAAFLDPSVNASEPDIRYAAHVP